MRLLFSFLLFTFHFASTAQIPSYVPTNGLVGWWPFNGNANDESGNGNNGVVNNCISISDRNNYSNSAYQFGNSSSINVSMTSQLFQLPKRTFSCWFRANGPQSGGRIYENSFMNGGIALHNGNMLDTWYAYSQHCCNISNINSGSLNQWHHLASISDDVTGLTKVYLDGSLIASSNGYPAGGGCNIPSAWQWQQGLMKFGLGASNESFNGDIDDIAIYNRALTPQEITQLYTGQVIPSYVPSNGLVGWWPFNGNANDESGNGNNGVVNGATLTSDRFGNVGKAYNFNGSNNSIIVPNSPTLNITGNQITISYWVNFRNNIANGNYQGISKGGYDVGSGYELIFRYAILGQPNNPGALTFNSGYGGFNTDSINSYQNSWTNFTSTSNNGIQKNYINGILQSGHSAGMGISNFSSNSNDLYFGTRDPHNSWVGFLDGQLDDIAIYNRALSQEEITQLFTRNTTSSTPEDTTSNVGIGTITPKRKLHVNDVMRLEPRNTAPANPAKGDIYFDGVLNKLRVYDGSVWQSCW